MGNSPSKQPEAQLDRAINGVRYSVAFNPQPFGRGACRHAFHGEYRGNGPLNGKQCVTKIFIEETRRQCDIYVPDVKASQKANELAEAFNATYLSTKPLRFVVPELATVTAIPSGNVYAKPGDKILIEDFIEGKYEKFNSNGGWQTDEVAAIPAFSHFTYSMSNNQFLVCDIQGVRLPNGYTLTDPAVHSRRHGEYGQTDLGPAGMARFFAYHRCTSVCRKFPTLKFNINRKILRGIGNRRASTYTFMLTPTEAEVNEYFKDRSDLPAIDEVEDNESFEDREDLSGLAIEGKMMYLELTKNNNI